MRPSCKGLHHKEDHAGHQRQSQSLHVGLDLWSTGRFKQRHHAQANPHGKSVERPHVGVVTLARLQRRLVQVHHNGEARHQEQQPHHGRAFGVSEGLERQPDQAQNQRKVEEAVPAAVFRHGLGQGVAASQTFRIDEIDPAQPVAVHEIAMALHVVLLANEVPEEVAEVHPPHLVVGEEAQVLALRRHQLFQGVGQPAFRLKGSADVVLASGLVGPLREATKVVFLGALGALQTLDVPLAVVESSVKLIHDVARQAGAHLRIAEGSRVHLARLGVAHQEDVLALQLKVGVKPLAVIGKQAAQHPLELRLVHAGAEHLRLHVGLEFRARHGGVQQGARVVRRTVEALVVAPFLVLGNVRSRGAVHPWEEHGEVGIVVGLGPSLFPTVHVFLHDEILLALVGFDKLLRGVLALEALDPTVDRATLLHDAVALHPRGFSIEVRLVKRSGRVPKLACGQRTVAVLFPAEVAQQRKEVLWIVLVHRRVGRRTDHDGRERAVAQQHHRHAEGQRVDGPPPLAVRKDYQRHQGPHEQREVDEGASVERHAQVVDEEQLEASGQLHRPFDQGLLHKSKKHDGHHPGQDQPLPRKFMVPVEVHQGDGRNGEQIQQVHTNGQPHEVGDQDDPLGRTRLIRHVFPLENGPKHQRRKEA